MRNTRTLRGRRASAGRIVAQVEEHIPTEVLARLAGPASPAGDDRERFRRIMKRVFGLGLASWIVERRWPPTLAALHDGDPERVARMDAREMGAFLARPDVIRNGTKLAAVHHNAAVVVALSEVYGDLTAYARAVSEEGLHHILDDLSSRLRMVGPISAARIAQELGVDVLVPHASVLRLLHRRGWLDDPGDPASVQRLAAELADGGPPPYPRGRLGAAFLAFATGRWSIASICGRRPACASCRARRGCPRLGVEEEEAA